MGVDHSAFICYGAEVDLPDGENEDIEVPDGISVCQWGSKNYGGGGGYLMIVDKTHSSTSMLRAVDITEIDKPKMLAKLQKACAKTGCTLTGEIGWHVGLLAW